MTDDVASPIDLRCRADAAAWAAEATAKRPYRTDIFNEFVRQLAASPTPIRRVLELGSGPGALAEQVLKALPQVAYVLFDFSPAMHSLAAERLGTLASRARFVEGSFKAIDWTAGLGRFDAVVTNQAVHELRHRRHAATLHAQVRAVLADGGRYGVCDHFAGDGGMRDTALFMTVDEQRQALLDAGFARVERVLMQGSLVLHLATDSVS